MFLLDGYNMLASRSKTLTLKNESIMEDASGLGVAYEDNSPIGKSRLMLTQGGAFFDTTANSIHTALVGGTVTPQATPRVAVVGAQGQTLGAAFWGVSGVFSISYEVALELQGLTKANAGYVGAGVVERGTIIQPLATKTADWNTKSLSTQWDNRNDPLRRVITITSSSVANPGLITCAGPHGLSTGALVLIAGHSGSTPALNLAYLITVVSDTTFTLDGINVTVGGTGGTAVADNSTGGASGYLEVTAFSGFTGFIGKLRDSTDDITYADLITFTNVTSGPTAQRVTVTGTVDRYMSFDGDVTGSGSITVFAGVART